MRILYCLLIYALLPLTVFKLLWRSRKEPAYLHHWAERYGYYVTRPSAPILWLHCVSVGETRAAQPLVESLLAHYPHHQILITYTTPTGRATGNTLFSNRVLSAYLPYDTPFAVQRFLHHFQPALGALLETELWPNLIHACHRNHIPLMLINARLSPRSLRRYQHIRWLMCPSLRALSIIAAQSKADAERFTALGALEVQVMGNMKSDVIAPSVDVVAGNAMRVQLARSKVWLAASTRVGEEKLIIDAWASLKKPPLLILVPRHPERFVAVADLLDARGIRFVRRSQLGDAPLENDCQVLLGDSMGEMFRYMVAADIVLMGGSLLPFGGQNLLEALVLAKPVLIGEHTFNFADISVAAIQAGAARSVNIGNLATTVQELLADDHLCLRMSQAALILSAQRRGATQWIKLRIDSLLATGG